MRARVMLAAVAVGGSLLIIGRSAWRLRPPYERGYHSDVVEAQSRSGHSDFPRIGRCPVFPADNVWNTPIDTLPKAQHSADYIASIGPTKRFHPDFGANLDYGIPYTLLPEGTRPVEVHFEFRDESDLGGYPLPPNVPIEGGTHGSGDRHVIMIDSEKCILYELYAAHPRSDGSWDAGSGIRMNLQSNQLRPGGWTSADAAGLPIFPGLIRFDEVASGSINHALRFTLPHTQSAYVWPARHKASSEANPRLPPMGTRFRLRADFDSSGFSKQNRVIVKALKVYGMFLADNGSAIFVSGVSDKRWDDDDLRKLGAITASDFEAVDENDLQAEPNSARVDQSTPTK